jgi:hypothetical protein
MVGLKFDHTPSSLCISIGRQDIDIQSSEIDLKDIGDAEDTCFAGDILCFAAGTWSGEGIEEGWHIGGSLRGE